MTDFAGMELSPKHWVQRPLSLPKYKRYLRNLRPFTVSPKYNCCWLSRASMREVHADVSHGRMIPLRLAMWLAYMETPVPTIQPEFKETDYYTMGNQCHEHCINPHHMHTHATHVYKQLMKWSAGLCVTRMRSHPLTRKIMTITGNWVTTDTRRQAMIFTDRKRYVRNDPKTADTLAGFDIVKNYTQIREDLGISSKAMAYRFKQITPLRPVEVALYWYVTKYLQGAESNTAILFQRLGIGSANEEHVALRRMLIQGSGYVEYLPVRQKDAGNSVHHVVGVGAYTMDIGEMLQMPPYIPAQFVNGDLNDQGIESPSPWYWRPVTRRHTRKQFPKVIRV